MRRPKICKACEAGLCAECSNWGAPLPLCEHLCLDSPRQLSFAMGDDVPAGRPLQQSQGPAGPPADEEVPW